MLGLIDFETQSECDLKHAGGRNYALHPTTRIICLVGLLDSKLVVWVNGKWDKSKVFVPWPKGWEKRDYEFHVGPDIPDDFLRCDTLVAHNADMFDRLVWEAKVDPSPRNWIDTVHRARATGLRGSLDELGKHFLGYGKDDIGKKMLNKMMTLPNKHTLPGNVGIVTSYCIADVLILNEIHQRLPEVSSFDIPVLIASNTINARGVSFDVELAKKIIQWSDEESEEAKKEVRGMIGDINLRSPDQMSRWLESEKVYLPDMRKETVELFLNDPNEFSDVEVSADVLRVLELRKSCLRITGSKLAGALANIQPDGRVRDGFTYHGAGPGRFSGRRVQVQNLPRGIQGLDIKGICDGTTSDVREAERLGISRATVHSTLIRPCFMGSDLLISDFNAIECRATAWFAQEDKLLGLFHRGDDPYLAAASRIFGRSITKADKVERFIGKETTLGSGYGMGAPKFDAYLRNKGVNLSDAGVTSEQCIEAFRGVYTKIVGLWHELDHACKLTVLTGTVSKVARCTIFMDGPTMKIQLPSSRILWYRKMRIEKRVPPWGGDPIPQLVYQSARGPSWLFGGKILENIAQGHARDLLCCAMVKCEERGLPIVLHVHDELVAERERDDVHTLARIMCEVPEWAPDFPIAVEYHASPRYTKSPWPDYPHGEMRSDR